MRFHYTAFQSDNKIIEGNTEAQSQGEVLSFLVKQGLRPISVKSLSLTGKGVKFNIFQKKITISDKLFLTKYLSLMLRVGTDLFKAIDILINDFDKPSVKNLLFEIRGALERGEPFHSTFLKYPNLFSPVFASLIKAGESSGKLDQVLSDLNQDLERENELRNRLRAALIYPILLLVMAFAILTFLITFALPRIAEVFSGGGFEPPFFSKVVFGIGLFLGKYIWILLGIGIVTFIGFIFYLRTVSGKRFGKQLLTRIPVIKSVIEKIALQRFTSTFASLMKSGLPIVETLEITANTVGNIKMQDALMRISRYGISKGLTLGEAFKRETAFPLVLVNLIAISEKAGHLDEILKTLSDFYDKEIDISVKSLVALVEPALLFVIGGVVAVIALSIIVPIYQLVGQF